MVKCCGGILSKTVYGMAAFKHFVIFTHKGTRF